jgi:hypothetical protein
LAGRTNAQADAAASALAHATSFDIRAARFVQWRWRISRLIEGADYRIAGREDSPVRLMFEFEGDKSRVSLRSGLCCCEPGGFPGAASYATLMYVRSNQLPSARSCPTRAPVASRWSLRRAARAISVGGTLERTVQDYVNAFGASNRAIVAVGVLWINNTGESVEACARHSLRVGGALARQHHRLQNESVPTRVTYRCGMSNAAVQMCGATMGPPNESTLERSRLALQECQDLRRRNMGSIPLGKLTAEGGSGVWCGCGANLRPRGRSGQRERGNARAP